MNIKLIPLQDPEKENFSYQAFRCRLVGPFGIDKLLSLGKTGFGVLFF